MSLRTILYATAIFLGSFLLFLIEPIAGKRLLPLLGGSAAVWTTCLVFFQTALLLGYLCAHWLATRFPPRAQAVTYTALLTAALAQAALARHSHLQASSLHPILSVFVLLTTLIGLPFVVLSATNPLLQAWYSRAYRRAMAIGGSSDTVVEVMAPPYRLFALSNGGSLLALVVYPSLLEPRFSLGGQTLGWLVGFFVFVTACIAIVWITAGSQPATVSTSAAATELKAFSGDAEKPRAGDRLLWLLLAACGSVLLCAFTNHLSQDVAAIPLLWIVPLIAYLLSFVWAFNGERYYPRKPMLPITAVFLGVLASFIAVGDRISTPIWFTVLFFCVCLFLFCLACHGELYRRRPSPRYATSFYLLIAAGGALGSVFVGVIAPLTFRGNYEFFCSLIFTALMLFFATLSSGVLARIFWSGAVVATTAFSVVQTHHEQSGTIAQVRNFYGTLAVTEDLESATTAYTRTLYHGTIQHGTQVFTDELRMTPTTYYGHDSGVGLALDHCCGPRSRRVGVIGLGTGTLAAYGREGDTFRFYDINPLVEKIARNWFSYLRETPAKVEIVSGDARLSLAAEAPQHYDVLVIDAFSGDAIPVHLLTREAIQLYLRQLQPDGILAVHVSNQYLNLPPVVRQEAEDAGLSSLLIESEEDPDIGVYSSDWVLVTRNQDFLRLPDVAAAGKPIKALPALRLWTDDYNSLLPLLKSKKFKWSVD
jgi:spermidine synthase